MLRTRNLFFIGLLFLSIAVFAKLYGPFRCDNNCNALDIKDGMTAAFIRNVVNTILGNEAMEKGQDFRWRAGDELTICDGKWCATSRYHPLTGIFILDPRSKPAYRDDGRITKNESQQVYQEIIKSPEFGMLLARLAGMCLRGMLNYGTSYLEGGDSYSWEGNALVVTSSYRDFNLGSDFCDF